MTLEISHESGTLETGPGSIRRGYSMITRLFMWGIIVIGIAAAVVLIGANLSPEGTAFQRSFQSIIDTVSGWF